MIEEKEILKQCRKEIDKANKICRGAPSENLVSKESKNLSKYTEMLDIESLNNNMSSETLQVEYEKCMKLKNKSEKTLAKLKGLQYSAASTIQNLRTICKNMEDYIKKMENMQQTEDLSTMQTILNQNILCVKHWIEEEEKLMNNIQVNVDVGVNLFKNYISKIVQFQKERLK